MPIYEYQCSKCGEVFEAFQKISDKPLSHCKFCNSRVERLISQSSFQLKGSGWYLTDYARKNQASGPSESSSKPEAKSEAKSERKADEKAPSTERAPSAKKE